MTLLVGLGIWSVLASVSSTLATFMNGMSILSFQVKVTTIASVVNIGLSIYLTYRIGLPGVLYGSIITQAFVVMIPYLLYIRGYDRVKA
jgi:O-antigen/teichoic acid export membrane protein